MKKVLVVIPMTEEEKQQLSGILPDGVITYSKSKEVTIEEVQESEIILGNVSPKKIQGSKKLKWLQLNSAGTDGYCVDGVLPEGTILTNASGAYGVAISEHMLGMILALQKKLYTYYENQKEHRWQDEGNVTGIYGTTTLIVGLGDIGGEFAKRMKALGSYTIGIRRTKGEKPDYLDELRTMEELNELLPRADFVSLSLPSTPETRNLFQKDRFALMKPSSILINVGRGNAIDTEALCDALEEHCIAGACLDVTEPEPLPVDHRLWNIPGVIITPHISGMYHMEETRKRIVKISLTNLQHYLNGEKLINVVNFETGYRFRQ